MHALTVIKRLNPLKNFKLCFCSCGKVLVVYKLSFKSVKEALHRCIIPTVTAPTHALDKPVSDQLVAKIIAGVLATSVGVEDRVSSWFLAS